MSKKTGFAPRCVPTAPAQKFFWDSSDDEAVEQEIERQRCASNGPDLVQSQPPSTAQYSAAIWKGALCSNRELTIGQRVRAARP